jgi:hypothetical protein
MRFNKFFLFAGAAVLSLSAAAAPQGAGTERVEVRAEPPVQARMKPFFYDRVQGEYALEDGRVLTISGHNRTLYADLGDGATQIIHIGKGKFTAIDKDVRFTFTGDRIPDEVVVSTAAGKVLALAKR